MNLKINGREYSGTIGLFGGLLALIYLAVTFICVGLLLASPVILLCMLVSWVISL